MLSRRPDVGSLSRSSDNVRFFGLASQPLLRCFFFFTDTAATQIYTLSLHDALPIYARLHRFAQAEELDLRFQLLHEERALRPRPHERHVAAEDREHLRNLVQARLAQEAAEPDRKSTRLNSSHRCISYAVFCLKKKNK